MQQNKNPLELFFTNPWRFWFDVLGTQVWLGALGYLFIFCAIAAFFIFLAWPKAIGATIALFVWIGPSILFTPLLLMFIIPNVRKGDISIPVGCSRNPNGTLVCM